MPAVNSNVHHFPSSTKKSQDTLSTEALAVLHIALAEGYLNGNQHRIKIEKNLDRPRLAAAIYGHAYRHVDHPEHGRQAVAFSTVESFMQSTKIGIELQKIYTDSDVKACLDTVDELMRWSGHLEGSTSTPVRSVEQSISVSQILKKLPFMVQIVAYPLALAVIVIVAVFNGSPDRYRSKNDK